MKITCQSCQSKYTVSDDKVQGKTVKIKCRKCGATILVSSSGVTTTNGGGPGDASPSTGASSYLVNVSDGDQRTMSLQELVDAYNTSVVTADTYVWSDGMSDWQPLSQVEAITSALQAGAAAAEPAAAPRAAARRDPAKRSQDLFGGGGEAPAADDVATSAPLFRSGGASAPKPKQGNEENSMLFSLSALTAKAAPAASGGPAARALNNEDSGIIDLKALTAAAESRTKAQAASTPASSGLGGLGGMMADDGGLFLAPPVLTAAAPAPAVVAPIEMPQKNRTPLFIGIGATVAIAAIVGAFMVMKGGGETPTQATTENTQPTAAPSPAPTPEPTPQPTAQASATATATASATAVAAAPKGGTAKPSGGTSKPAGGAATTAGKPAGGTAPAGGSTPTTTKPKGNCNCPPGDLMCAMKCSTK